MSFTPWGYREITISAILFVLVVLASVFLFRHYGAWWLLLPIVPAVLVFAWSLAFFRDPPRDVPTEPGIIVSPADGAVTHLDMADEPDYIGGEAARCSIFLSIFNVHLNRAPVAGTVEYVQYRPGAFFDARREESLVKNENKDIGLACSEAGLPSRVVVRQSTGAVARRIVCPVETGRTLARGELYGMIKFGSRTTLFLSKDVEITWRVKVGDAVEAGKTVLATVEPIAADKAIQP